MKKNNLNQSIGQNLDNFLKKLDKTLPGSYFPTTFLSFIFNLFITLPIFLLVLVPSTIIFLIIRKLLGYTAQFLKINYLDINEIAQDIIPQNERKFDLVIFGATGFTGTLAANYIAQNYQRDLKWTIAGRSLKKLEKIKQNIVQINPKLHDLPILITDSDNVEQLREVVKNTKVIISTVGPFAKYGTKLVAVCAEYGTHYCDITGEVDWVRSMIQKYDNLAQKSGAMIINCCGCDSIPWDLLSFKISSVLKTKYQQKMVKIDHFDYMKGNFSGGTMATLQYALKNPIDKNSFEFDPMQKEIGVNKKVDYNLTPVIQRFLGFNKIIGKYVGFGVLADGNADVVKRSNVLLKYSENLIYSEQIVHQNFFAGFNIQMGLLIMGVFLVFLPVLKHIQKYILPQPGQGPTQKQMESAFLTVRSLGTGDKGQIVGGLINFPNDPGYKDTSRMLVETGISIVKNLEQFKKRGGFQTPASGLGDILIDRLVQTGCQVEILDFNDKIKQN